MSFINKKKFFPIRSILSNKKIKVFLTLLISIYFFICSLEGVKAGFKLIFAEWQSNILSMIHGPMGKGNPVNVLETSAKHLHRDSGTDTQESHGHHYLEQCESSIHCSPAIWVSFKTRPNPVTGSTKILNTLPPSFCRLNLPPELLPLG